MSLCSVALCSVALAAAGCTGPRAVDASEEAAAASGQAVSPAVVSTETTPSSTAFAVPTDRPPSTALALPTPLTMLEIGDSLGEDLGFGLQDVLRGVDGVELVQAAKGNSGLVQPQYYDWPKHLSQLLDEHHPDVVVVFLGANDVQDFYDGGVYRQFGTVGWRQAYAQRVAAVMQEATDAGAKVLWVGMPIMKSATFSSSMAKLNDIYQAQAALRPGVTYLPSWNLFTDAAGNYVKAAQIGGKSVMLRTADGVHITFGNGGGGADVLAAAVVSALPSIVAQ